MTLCHVRRKTDPFVRFDKSIVYDSRLTWKAKGILSYAFSRPDNWKFYKSEIMKHSADGEASFETGIKELEKFGYLHKTRARNKKTGQMDGWEWHFCEVPITEEEFKKSSPQGDFTHIGKIPTSVKSPPNKNDYINKKENNNKEAEPKTPTAVVVPSHKEIILEPAIEKPHAEIISKPAVEKNHKEKLLERTKLTAPEQMGIKTKFGHLSDDVFTEAIEAFFEYEGKNGSENYIALLKSALGANEYKKPWTKNQAVQTAQDKELERKKHEDKIFFRKYRVKAMQDKYETNKYFTRKDGHIINFKIGEKFCEYQMRDMVRYAMIIYDSDSFEKEIDALEKEIEKRINAEKK